MIPCQVLQTFPQIFHARVCQLHCFNIRQRSVQIVNKARHLPAICIVKAKLGIVLCWVRETIIPPNLCLGSGSALTSWPWIVWNRKPDSHTQILREQLKRPLLQVFLIRAQIFSPTCWRSGNQQEPFSKQKQLVSNIYDSWLAVPLSLFFYSYD